MSAITDFSANPSDGALTYVWDVSSSLINHNNVKTIKLLITDSATLGTLSSSIIATDVIPIYTYDLDSNIIGINKTFTVSGLTNNKVYIAMLEITTKAGAYYRSASSISSYPGKAPIKPVFQITKVSGDLSNNVDANGNTFASSSTAVSGNGTVSFRLTNYTFNSESDGYYKITGVQAYIADGTRLQISDFSNVDVANGLYINEYRIGGEPGKGLITGKLHEIAVSVFNAAGTSVMSDTVLITPGNSVQAVSLVSMPTIEYNRTVLGTSANSSSATLLFSNAPNAVDLASNPDIAVQKYEIFRADASANNVVVTSNPKTLVATFDVSGGQLSGDGLSSGSTITYNGSTYNFVFEDTTVVSGKNYTYTVVGSNSIGTGPSSNATTTLVGSYADQPLISVTPGNGTLKVNISSSSLNGLKATVPPSYLLDISGSIYTAVLDSSNNYTVSGLTNGLTYSIKAATRTTDGIRLASPYIGLYSQTLTSTPYTTPAAPVITATPVDSSNVPLNGKVKLTWTAVTNTGGNSGAITYSVFVNDVLNTTTTDTTYTVSGLTNGTSYKFSVKTNVENTEILSNISSAFSNEVNVVPFTTISNVASASLTRINGTSLSAEWTQPANILTYGLNASNVRYIVKVTDASSGSVRYDSSGSLVSPITITGLTSGTLYKIEVTSGYLYSGTIYYNTQPVVSYGTPYGTITAPQNVVLYPLNNSIRITWDRNLSNGGIDVIGYDIYITSTGVSGIDYKAARVNYDTEYFIAAKDGNLSDLFNGSQYRVKINVVGTVKSSPTTTMEVSGDQFVGLITPSAGPSAPSILSNVGSNGFATVTWARDNTTPASGYTILDSNKNILASFALTDVSSVWTVTSTTVSFTYYNLINNVAYPLSIFAYKTASPLNITSAETPVTLYPAEALGAPTNLGFTVDSSSITLSWIAPTNAGQAGVSGNSALKYKIIIDASDSGFTGNAVTVDNISNTFYTANGNLVNNKKYVAYVFAYYTTSGGELYQSSAASYYYIIPNPAPQTVTGLTATPGDKLVTLSWVNPTDTAIYTRTNTIISRSTSLTPDASYVQIASIASGSTTYVDNSVSIYNGRTYYYKVLSPHGGVAVEGAQQALPVYSTGVVPFGKPVIYDMSHNLGTGKYHVSLSKNGSNLQEYILFAVDPSGLEIPVYNANVGPVTYGGAIDNTNRIEAGNRYTLDITVSKAFDDILFGIQNAAGITIIHDGSLAFGSGNEFTIN